ncbi:unnamed protein product [Brachionus calyciflorus]|uniref:ISXO2-like transposase domain-containing protein n=1 Tax=Brachionus calyciflorus TaxID=104777 RepID=A0A814FYL6_9BILA|nr:unnamed protein product [Brachionus calyciflorus]
MHIVPNREAITLLNIIYEKCKRGTTIYSDCWAAYGKISSLKDFKHITVNHSLHFIEPQTKEEEDVTLARTNSNSITIHQFQNGDKTDDDECDLAESLNDKLQIQDVKKKADYFEKKSKELLEPQEDTQIEIRKVEEYNYLGSYIRSSERDIEMRIGLTWTAFEKLRHILSSSKLDLKLRMRIFNAACIPVLLYRCESWKLTEKSMRKLNCLARTFYVWNKTIGATLDK